MYKAETHRFKKLVLVLWLLAFPTVVAAESVAMITDMVGAITAQSAPSKGNITILAELEKGARLQLPPSARLVVIYLRSGDEYSMQGPGLVEFGTVQPIALSGAAPVRRSSPLAAGGSAVRIKPVAVTQAALVMRSARPAARIKLLNLSGTKTLEAQPEFRWQGLQPGIEYRIDITDDTGRSLQEARVDGTSFRLPPGLGLVAGANYTWEVSVRLPDGRKYSTAGDFSLASPELRAQAEGLRPAASAPLSMRVAYAAWLDQMDLKDEARTYWRALSAERPEDARLKAHAGE